MAHMKKTLHILTTCSNTCVYLHVYSFGYSFGTRIVVTNVNGLYEEFMTRPKYLYLGKYSLYCIQEAG